jgi:S1-C subfamily serine protease
VDHFEPQPRRISLIALAGAALLACAFALSALALLQGRAREAHAHRLEREVRSLERQIDRLRSANARLAGRVGSTERTLRRRDAGIAPLARRVLGSVFTVETPRGYGSGFAGWQEDGATFVVTAHHVVEDAGRPYVTVTRKGGSWGAEIVARDAANDLAVLRVSGRPADAEPLWPRVADAARPRPGDQLLLVGSPFGLEGTVTTGVVSRVARREIQTDAAANPGNSGGPALDRDGRVVGVLVAGGGQNVNFVVPIELACRRIREC